MFYIPKMKEPTPENPQEPKQDPQEEMVVYENVPCPPPGVPFNVFLDGPIGQGNLANDVIKNLLFWESKNIKSALTNMPIYPIILHISSYGGDVYDSLRIIDTIKGLETPVVTYCSGKAMSGAALILMAGEPGHRLASPSSWIMVHELSSMAAGSLSQMNNTSDHLKKLQKQLDKQISKYTGIEKAKLSKLLQSDQYFTATQSIGQGICDKVAKNVPKIIEGISMAYFTNMKSGIHEIGPKKKAKKKDTKKGKTTKKIRKRNNPKKIPKSKT